LESDNSQFKATLHGAATSFSDSGLLPGREYDYDIAAINLEGPSEGVDVIVETVPLAPAGPSATGGGEQIVLQWTAEGHAVGSYNIYRGNSAGAEGSTPIATDVTGAMYTDSNVINGQTYYYEITAVDDGGESVMSTEVFAAPLMAVQSGSALTVNIDGAGYPMSLGTDGPNITVSANGQTQQFSGVTSILVNGSAVSAVLSVNGPLGAPLSFLNGAADTLSIVSGALTIPAGASGTGIQSVNLNTLSVASGASLLLSPSDAISDQTQLMVQNLSLTGTLDLANNSLAINYPAGASPFTQVQSELVSGYNNGAWNGPGIISSSAAASGGQFALADADGSVDSGTSAAPDQVLVAYALAGDANMDGGVNITDLLTLLNNLGRSGTDWSQGDFNYDGAVNITDLLAMLNNYGSSAAGAASATPPAAKQAAVASQTWKSPPGAPIFSDVSITTDSDLLDSQPLAVDL
jgi:Dockerin type I domain